MVLLRHSHVASLIQGSLEVVPRTLHKGLLIEPLLKRIEGGRLAGFVLMMGDEESDHKMIEVKCADDMICYVMFQTVPNM